MLKKGGDFSLAKATKNKGGRPEVITEQKLNQFQTFIIAGCSLKEACEQIEISTNTWRRYMKRHPSYVAKFARWKKELEARAKLNIAMKITNEKDTEASVYYLERQTKLRDQAARTSLNRAKAQQTRLQNKLLKKQLEQIDTTASKARDSMSKLDMDTLKRLANLDQGVDISGID